jgi:hypothetical protein
MDVMPTIKCSVRGIDAKRFDRIDQLQHSLDLGPARQPQQNIAAGRHIGHRGATLTGRDCPQDVDPRDDRAKVI